MNTERAVRLRRLRVAAVLLTAVLCAGAPASAREQWEGVDKAVVEKQAKKYGVEPREPFINTDQGDMLLFIFTLAGTAAGIVIGYNFRRIFKEKKSGHLS